MRRQDNRNGVNARILYHSFEAAFSGQCRCIGREVLHDGQQVGRSAFRAAPDRYETHSFGRPSAPGNMTVSVNMLACKSSLSQECMRGSGIVGRTERRVPCS